MKPDKPLSAWLAPGANPFGQPHQHDYGKISRMLDGWKQSPGPELLFVKLGSRAAIAKQLRDSRVAVPGRSQLANFIHAWLYENAPDWYWKSE